MRLKVSLTIEYCRCTHVFFCVTVAPNFYFYIFILYSILFIYFPSKVLLTIHGYGGEFDCCCCVAAVAVPTLLFFLQYNFAGAIQHPVTTGITNLL